MPSLANQHTPLHTTGSPPTSGDWRDLRIAASYASTEGGEGAQRRPASGRGTTSA